MKFGLSLGKVIAFLVIIVVVTMAVSYGALLFLAWRNAGEIGREGARHAAENTASHLVGLTALLNQGLKGLAGDPRLATVIAQADPALLRSEEERITRALPGALLIRLLPENIQTLDETRSPRMGFSDLDMVKSALSSPQPPAIHLANSQDVHLAMAQRLENGGGVIHASLPLKLLEDAMSIQGACALALRQDGVLLAYRGDEKCQENQPDGELAVAGSPWNIVYWAPRSANVDVLGFGAVFLVFALVLAAIAFVSHRFLLRLFRQDREKLLCSIHDILQGYMPGDYAYKFAEFGSLGKEINAMREETKVARFHAQPEEPVKPSLPSAEPPKASEREAPPAAAVLLSPSLFLAYDIRGVVGETLTAEIVYILGLAIGSEVFARGESRIAMARDGRLSSPELGDCLMKGLMDSGCTVVNLGLAPTPLLYFATHVLNTQSGVMLTGSHNPANYNGLKIVIGGEALKDEGIQQLRRRIEQRDFHPGSGRVEKYDLIPDYIERIVGDIQLGRSMKIVMDCGNGAAAVVAPEAIRALGCEVIELFCEVDGHFPNHHPDPSRPENLQALIAKVLEVGAELGVAFDGDGDRLGLVDSGGKIIWPDRQMMLFAADLLSREPGADIIYDVKCSRHLASQIVKNGGRPLMWKTGHSPMKAKLKETGAMLAGEMSGHIIFAERWYGFDDGIYACARMIEILSNEVDSSAKVFAQFPDSINTPELNIPLAEGESSRLIEAMRAIARFPDARVTDIDGLRVDFPDGWGLVRASNTTPALTLRFEADNEESLAQVQQQFRELLQRVKTDIQLPF